MQCFITNFYEKTHFITFQWQIVTNIYMSNSLTADTCLCWRWHLLFKSASLFCHFCLHGQRDRCWLLWSPTLFACVILNYKQIHTMTFLLFCGSLIVDHSCVNINFTDRICNSWIVPLSYIYLCLSLKLGECALIFPTENPKKPIGYACLTQTKCYFALFLSCLSNQLYQNLFLFL